MTPRPKAAGPRPEPHHDTYVIDVIAGDGIGQEVMPSALDCVEAVGAALGFSATWRHRDWGSDHYRRTGMLMPSNGIDLLSDADAVLFGAVGDTDIPDDVTLWGLLIPIRRAFDQYINLRPARSLPGVPIRVTSSEPAPHIDILIVRENVEGEYSQIGGRFTRGQHTEFAIQEAVFTRTGVSRVARYAAEQARRRSGSLVSATKSNGILHSMSFWDEVVADTVAAVAPEVSLRSVLVDALSAELVLRPEHIDVIVASNLFGDILSDLAAAVTGSIGSAPSANINPERRYPSLFEPVHGSAPDIAGQGIANPVGQIWSAALMLEHLGRHDASDLLLSALWKTLESGTKTRDLGGRATTAEFTDALRGHLDDCISAQQRSAPRPLRISTVPAVHHA